MTAKYLQNQLKLKNGLGTMPHSYQVLVSDQLSAVDKAEISKVVSTLLTPEDTDVLTKQTIGWSFRILDTLKHVGVLAFRGVPVALFYKRMCNTITPMECDPVPLKAIEDPKDLWMRFSLIGPSSRQLSLITARQEANATGEIVRLQNIEIANLEAQLASQEVRRESAEKGLSAVKAGKASVYPRVAVAKQKAATKKKIVTKPVAKKAMTKLLSQVKQKQKLSKAKKSV